MKITRLVLPFLLFGLLAGVARAAGGASFQGILIVASNEKGATDPHLAPYESTLRRILRFESYRFVGEGSANVAVPGNGAISLGRGQRIELETDGSGGRGLKVTVRWLVGGRAVMNTGLSLGPGSHVVLGEQPTGKPGEVYAVIFIRE
jgi:hypothetical protein